MRTRRSVDTPSSAAARAAEAVRPAVDARARSRHAGIYACRTPQHFIRSRAYASLCKWARRLTRRLTRRFGRDSGLPMPLTGWCEYSLSVCCTRYMWISQAYQPTDAKWLSSISGSTSVPVCLRSGSIEVSRDATGVDAVAASRGCQCIIDTRHPPPDPTSVAIWPCSVASTSHGGHRHAA